MVSTDEALESKYVTADLVKNSESKKLVTTDEGKYEDVTYNNETSTRLTIPVEVDGKAKIWRPNRDSVKNMSEAHGKDTKEWVGKPTSLRIMTIQGKDLVIATGE